MFAKYSVIYKSLYNAACDVLCHASSYSFLLKVTYHENLNFPGFKCYNQVPSVSTNQANVKKINPVTFVLNFKLFLISLFLQHLKKGMRLISLP